MTVNYVHSDKAQLWPRRDELLVIRKDSVIIMQGAVH